MIPDVLSDKVTPRAPARRPEWTVSTSRAWRMLLLGTVVCSAGVGFVIQMLGWAMTGFPIATVAVAVGWLFGSRAHAEAGDIESRMDGLVEELKSARSHLANSNYALKESAWPIKVAEPTAAQHRFIEAMEALIAFEELYQVFPASHRELEWELRDLGNEVRARRIAAERRQSCDNPS